MQRKRVQHCVTMYTRHIFATLCIILLHGCHVRGDDAASCNTPFTCMSPSECSRRHGGPDNLYNGIIFQCEGGKKGNENVCCPQFRANQRTSRKPHSTFKPTVRPTTRIPTQHGTNKPKVVDLNNHKNIGLLSGKICGSQFVDKIINGDNAALGQFPWMVLLGYTDPNNAAPNSIHFYCGGSLITNRYVLTAAHCVDTANAGTTLKLVRLGELNITSNPDCEDFCAPEYIEIDVETIIPHNQYNTTTLKNDIALIRLKSPIAQFTDYVKPICLPFGSVNLTGAEEGKYRVAGWGKLDSRHDNGSAMLQYADVISTSIADCNREHNTGGRFLTETQLCAGGGSGQDACKGDSGGPLMHTQPGQAQVSQIGIVSFGFRNCGTVGSPSIYTRVSAYLLWILDNIAA